MKKIDCHGHMMFPEVMGKAGSFGPQVVQQQGQTILQVGPYVVPLPNNYASEMTERTNADYLARDIERNGIDMINIMAPPLFYFYWAPKDIAIPFVELQNDLLARQANARPDRIFWSAILPMQDVPASIAEAKRAAALGAKSINIGTDRLGCGNLDSEAYWPLYEVLSELDLTILVHPYPAPMAQGEEDRYNMSWITGYPGQEATAFAAITLGGVLDDFPKLRFAITHGGGFVPYQFGRIAGAFKTKVPGLRAKRPIEEYLDNFWFDTTVHDDRARRFLYEFMGADRLFVGSNYSGWNWINEFEHLDHLQLSDDELAKISHKNAERLFGLKELVG